MYVHERPRWPIRIISRAKRSFLGDHWGVQLPDGHVIHLTPEGVSLVSLDAFAEGRRVQVVREADPGRYHGILMRVRAALRSPQQYRLTDRNCETFANELLGDPPNSPQVLRVTLIGMLGLAIWAAPK